MGDVNGDVNGEDAHDEDTLNGDDAGACARVLIAAANNCGFCSNALACNNNIILIISYYYIT